MTTPQISIIIPCYNEREYISQTVTDVLMAFGPDVEVIVVDDGSKDGSVQELSSIEAQDKRIRIIIHEHNKGKGAAIRTGVMAATGSVIGFIDGDGEVDSQYLVEAVSIIRESDYVDIVIGNRYMIPNGYKTTAVRRLYSHVYRLMNWLLFALPWKDTQAGLKAFRDSVAKELFGASDIHGYAFDIDILAHAHRRKLRIEELPIVQILKGESTITKRHILRMIVDTVETYGRFAKEEWRGLRIQRNPFQIFAFLLRQIFALPTAIAAWTCAKAGLFILKKIQKQ